MSTEQEQQWESQLKKTRQKVRMASVRTKEDEKKDIAEMLLHTKDRLQKALSVRADDDAILRIYNTLTELRAKQLGFFLADLTDRLGFLDEQTIGTYTQNYQKECLDLAMAIDASSS